MISHYLLDRMAHALISPLLKQQVEYVLRHINESHVSTLLLSNTALCDQYSKTVLRSLSFIG